MKIKFAILSLCLITWLLLSTCNSKNYKDETLYATLWLQASGEYRAITEQVYRMAEEIIPTAVRDSTWTAALEQKNGFSKLPPAVILDIDQTIVDNSPFKARMIKANIDFDANAWKDWVQAAKIPALPGVLEFVKLVKSQGVKIFYVTNRLQEFKKATRQNLEHLGLPTDLDLGNILTKDKNKNWGEDKTSRRAFIAERYRVLLIIGDDLNDFISALVSPEERFDLADRYKDYWGRKWILLPNPLYGSWERALYNYEMKLSTDEKRRLKYRRLITLD